MTQTTSTPTLEPQAEARFIDLEIRLTYQEASIAELEEALRSKDKQIRTLEERITTLEDFIREQMRDG